MKNWRGTIEKTKENEEWFNRKGCTMTGETYSEEYEDETATAYVVFKGTWTRSGTVRDCGDHYIIARYSRFDRINKETLEITKDVEDR